MKKKLLLLLAGFVAAALLAELVLRVFFGAYITQIYALDPVLLHRLIPGTSKYFVHHPVNGGGRVLVRVNAQGFRGDELLPDGAARRVVVFGDSFVMAEVVAEERTFTEQLEQALAAALHEPVEVVNAGVVTYGPDQSLLHMEQCLPRLRPELAVLAIFADNDFGDLMRNKMFKLDAQGALVPHAFAISDKLRLKFAEGSGSTALYRCAKKMYRSLREKRAVDAFSGASPEAQRAAAVAEVERQIAECDGEYRHYVVENDASVQFLLEDHFDSDVCVAPDSESARYKIALLGAVLGRAAASAKSLGVPLCVVVVPSPFDLCGPEHGGVVDRQKHPGYDPHGMCAIVAAHAQAHGLPCVDLFEPFRARGADDLYFLAPDNHWNELGQELGAKVVAEFLLARALLKAR